MATKQKGELLARAKRRCQDCYALVEKKGKWYCDWKDVPIEKILVCEDWEDNRGDLDNPEWDH